MNEPHIIEEREIPSNYLFKSPSESKPMGYLDRFEVRRAARDYSRLNDLRDEDKECDGRLMEGFVLQINIKLAINR